ncbi:hypothetical protein EZI54_10495 [Marinobacter halodurans]|uniref:DUF6896 domain-containing protein n=1 Tax=Marinobacter halodurans TaxID=2528979 RepID=A0ABY1ZKL0_9GAMM|nr:hypothetical protein [Marinobacter halodurans]TBW56061.1 hypothetical protein EZI54_10495 [Marinobacter halodurans]
MSNLIKQIHDFLVLQSSLLVAFFRAYPDCRDLKFLLDFPRSGLIAVGDDEWHFFKHGSGLLFIRKKDGLEVDVRRAVGDYEIFDLNRIEQFLETSGQPTEFLEGEIKKAIKEGAVLVVDFDYRLLRLADQT